MTPDVNVWVAASGSDHPLHSVARTWLERAVTDASQATPLNSQSMVIASFLRLVAHRKIFVHPTLMPKALRFIDALLSAPGAEQKALGPEWPGLRKLCDDKTHFANAVPDAWLAADVNGIALRQGCDNRMHHKCITSP